MSGARPDWAKFGEVNPVKLDYELAAQRRYQARRLQEAEDQLNKGISRVDSRLGSVSERIEALFRWTELRFQQVEFDEYQARKEIRNIVRALAEGRPARAPEFEDVPGYWLPPAAAAVLPLVLRDREAAQRSAHSFADLKTGLEAARERDAVRAELFNLAVGLCFDQPALIDAAVLRLLAEPADLGAAEPGQVAAGWRALWEHAALGVFGPEAEAQIASLLRERFDPADLDEDELAAWDAAVWGFGGADGHRLPKDQALTALAAHLAAEPDAEPERDDQLWRTCLQELIDEPSPAELPVVHQMDALGLDGEGPQASRPSWTAAAGTLPALLRRDLFDPETPIPLRRLALDLAAPLLRERFDSFEAGLGIIETVTITVRRRGEAVDVTRDGHDPERFAALERRIDAAYDTEGPSTTVTGIFAGAFAALALFLLVIGQFVLAGLIACVAALPVVLHRNGNQNARTQITRRDEQLAEVRAALVKARKDAEREEREATDRGAAAREALARLRDTLPAQPPASTLG